MRRTATLASSTGASARRRSARTASITVVASEREGDAEDADDVRDDRPPHGLHGLVGGAYARVAVEKRVTDRRRNRRDGGDRRVELRRDGGVDLLAEGPHHRADPDTAPPRVRPLIDVAKTAEDVEDVLARVAAELRLEQL